MARRAPVAAAAFAVAFAVACAGSDGSAPLPTEPTDDGNAARVPIAVGALQAGTVARGATAGYRATVAPGSAYVVALVGLTDSLVTLRVRDGAAVHAAGGSGSPKDMTVRAAGPELAIDVVGAGMAAAAGSFTVAVLPAPPGGTMPLDVSTFPAGEARPGWVESRGEVRYRVPNAANRRVALVGLTAAAELKVYPDSTYTMESPCTLQQPAARECAVPGAEAVFAVRAGGVNREGAAFVMVVW